MVGEAHDYSDQPSPDPNQVAQISVGVAAKNRFGLPEFSPPAVHKMVLTLALLPQGPREISLLEKQ